MKFSCLITAGLLLSLALSPAVRAHGSVTAEDDLCVIRIGYFRAHFKIHLPRSRQHEEFCEDLPRTGEALFVMEYSHGDLGSTALDFRIIRNVTGQGRFAQLDDVRAIENLDSVTVFQQGPASSPDVFTALHHFAQKGEYLGLISATDPDNGEVYAAVFPFEVGYTRVGKLPLFLGLALLIQLAYWFMGGGRQRWRQQRTIKGRN